MEIDSVYRSCITGNVLLVDNDDQELISHYIKTAGAKVDVTGNGKNVVKMDLKDHYDLIIMDVAVIDDLEEIRLFKSDKHKAPIVFLVASDFFDIEKDNFTECCDDFLTKPVNIEQFFKVLQRYLPSSIDGITPLKSSLLENEPELLDLIKKYVYNYPGMISELKVAFGNSDFKRFEMLLHDIKSTGGNYGFMLITELAIMIKTHLNKDNKKAVVLLLDELEALHQRMELALL